MRIAMLGHKRIPSHEGGIEVVVEELAARMVEKGHQVTCFNRTGQHVSGKEYEVQKLDEYRGIRIRHVPTLDKKGLAAVTSSFFASLAAALGPYDVVHVHAEGPAAFCWLPRLFGEKVGARFAHEIIVLNHSSQTYFRDTYHRETHYIPNGVNRPAYAPPELIRKRFGLEYGSYLLFLGRLVPEKGCHHLCEAFKRLKTDKKLVIAGGVSDSGDYINTLKALAAGDDRILFTDFVDGALRDELYSNAYLFVLPSDLEGMPLSLLEAMSYGNCVLVSDIEECTNVIHDRGITFRKGDVNDLEAKLHYAIEHPNAVRMFKWLSSDYICDRFQWDKVVDATLKLYQTT